MGQIASLSVAQVYTAVTGWPVNGAVSAHGERRVRCPIHAPDNHPSCDLNESKGTWICRSCGNSGGILDLIIACIPQCETDAAAAAWAHDRFMLPDDRRETYRYQLLDGTFVKNIIRVDGPEGKVFHVEPTGAPHVPYRLDLIDRARKEGRGLMYPEGERKVNRLVELGFLATTNPHGAAFTLPMEWTDYFAGVKRVILLPDNDAPGRQAIHKRAPVLQAAGCDVRVLSLPNLPAGGDVIDWLAAGGTGEQLTALANHAPRYVADDGLIAWDDRKDQKTYDWLVDGLILRGGICLAVSDPKVGKSVLLANLALAVVTGRPFLGRATHQGPVVFLALEEQQQQFWPRLERLGMPQGVPLYVGFTTDLGAEPLSWVERTSVGRGAVLTIIDVMGRLVPKIDFNDYGEVTRTTDPLLRLARNRGISQGWAHHTNKVGGISGSLAWAGVADTIITLKAVGGLHTISTVQRTGENLEESVVTMDETGALELAGLRSDWNARRIAKDVATFLDDCGPEGASRAEIKKGVHGQPRTVQRAMRQLIAEGKVIELEKARGNRGGRLGLSRLGSLCATPQNTVTPQDTADTADRTDTADSAADDLFTYAKDKIGFTDDEKPND